jgi:hypothetical protein
MAGNTSQAEKDLVESAVSWLRNRLPDAWVVDTASRPGFVEIRAQNVYATLAVEARSSFGPKDVDRLLGSAGRRLREFNPNLAILVVAPWLSRRTQELLAGGDFNYLDLTGNALLKLDNPAVYVDSQGADKDPWSRPRGKARLRGPKAGRLVRYLADVSPPYGVTDVAAATGLAPGYVSRLLATLDEEALITRAARGRVVSSEIESLIQRWSETYDVFETNEVRTFIAPAGAADGLRRLGSAPGPIAVTGSFAAVRVAPIAAPALLCAYTDNADAVAGGLDLVPASEGANVALLRPFDPVVWERTVESEGILFVAPSQLAVDCLTGTGRMPAEGQAVVDWMVANEDVWRQHSPVALV